VDIVGHQSQATHIIYVTPEFLSIDFLPVDFSLRRNDRRATSLCPAACFHKRNMIGMA
jgi:hypothetical protein